MLIGGNAMSITYGEHLENITPNSGKGFSIEPQWEKTDIECPECGRAVYKIANVILNQINSGPAFKHLAECKHCEWEGKV